MPTVADLLEPLYECQVENLMQAKVLGGDDSPMPVVDNEKAKRKKGYFHCFRNFETDEVAFRKRLRDNASLYFFHLSGSKFLSICGSFFSGI